MHQKIFTQIDQVCRRRGYLRVLTATCWALAAVLVTALVLIALDRLFNITSPVGRILWTSLWVASCAFFAHRWYRKVSEASVTPLQVAQEIEHQHPQLRDVVTSAWDFDQQDGNDPTAGSESLRRAVVLRAATANDDVDWQRLLPREPLRLAAIALTSVGITLGLLHVFLPQTMKIGRTRLVNPLNSVEWPREHDLQFVEPPSLLAAGDDLVLQLRDTRGTLPASITMHYRTRRQGHWHETKQSLAPTADPFEIRRSNVQKSLDFRATGSDHHTMPWQPLEVVAPPRVETLQVTVNPPPYTKLSTQLWDKNSPLYAGSNLQLRGRLDQPVTQVILYGAKGKKIVAQISADAHAFHIPPSNWRVTESDTYGLQLTTQAGLTVRSAAKLVLEVVTDQPPLVRFLQPRSDLAVLSTATVPLVIEATDELAIRQMELLYHRSNHSTAEKSRLSLWRANGETTRQQRMEFQWDLTTLSLEPGNVVEVHAQASDNQPKIGQTVRALRLTIVSEEELWLQIVDQQARLAEVLALLLAEQRDLRNITTDWSEFPEWSTARWANSNHAALYRQRQISDALVEGPHSVLAQLTDLTQTLEANGLQRPQAADRWLAVQTLLQNLVDEPLALAEQSMSALTRQSQRSLERELLAPFVAETAEYQDQIVDGLLQAIHLLLPSNLLGRLERELIAIQTEQAKLSEHCRVDLAPQVLESNRVKPAQLSALGSVVRRQRDLVQRFAELMLNMAQTAGRLADDEPASAMRLTETVAFAKDLRLQATLQEAADQLAQRRLGRSASLQQQSLDDLAKLLARLAGQDTQESAASLERLQSAEKKLARLRQQLGTLQQKLQQRRPEQQQRELEQLRHERDQLAQQSEALAHQIERLRIARAAEATRKAASQLRRAKLDKKSAQQAKQHLDEAQQQLTTERRRQQVALARLQMAQLSTQLSDFLRRQQTIRQEILRHPSLRKAAGQLRADPQQSVQQLAQRQADLGVEVSSQAANLQSLPVFAHLLNRTGETMQKVKKNLDQSELGEPTQAFAAQAVEQLKQLAHAVQQERKQLSANNRSPSGAGQGNAGDKPQQQTLQLTLGQLRLLKSLQAALRKKTQVLEKQLAANQTPTNLAVELVRQQQQLTDLARQLVPEPPDPPTEKLFPNFDQQLEQLLDERFVPETQQQKPPVENQP